MHYRRRWGGGVSTHITEVGTRCHVKRQENTQMEKKSVTEEAREGRTIRKVSEGGEGDSFIYLNPHPAIYYQDEATSR